MTSKRGRPAAPRKADAEAPAPLPSARDGLRRFVLGQIVGATLGRFEKLIAAVILGAAGVFLTVAWEAGPKRAVDAARDGKLTARAVGRIVESWMAVELDPTAMGKHTRWRAFAFASPCAVVEYGGDWGAPARRAFCGNRFKFSEEYTLHDVREMSPRVPFAWARDESGFILPELRMTPAARQWLESHPADWLQPMDPPAATALEGLRLQLDRPVDAAIAGWSAPSPTITLAVDPKHPEAALPAGLLDSRHSPNWVVFVLIAIPGLGIWYGGMTLLFSELSRAARILMMMLPLLFLPWWAEHFPRYLSYLNQDFAGVIFDMIGDIDPLGHFSAREPEAAILAGGERFVLQAGKGAYSDTFGRFRFTRPERPLSADEAPAALAATIAGQMRSLPDEERSEIFKRLERDKVLGRRRAGLVFLAAAREAVVDSTGGETVRRAAGRFLDAWFTQPREAMSSRDPGYQGRLTLYAAMADLPMPGIAASAREIAGQTAK